MHESNTVAAVLLIPIIFKAIPAYYGLQSSLKLMCNLFVNSLIPCGVLIATTSERLWKSKSKLSKVTIAQELLARGDFLTERALVPERTRGTVIATARLAIKAPAALLEEASFISRWGGSVRERWAGSLCHAYVT
jgi:hypothetical protein